MTLDVPSLIGAVTRAVHTGERDGRPTQTVRAERTYPTDAADLWDAVTTGARLSRWFAPVGGELRLGGRYQIEGNAGGEVLACEPPQRYSISWEFNGDTSWVDVEVTPDGDGARLVLAHTAHVGGEFWDQFGPGSVGIGWDLGLFGLGRHLATGAGREPGDDEAFGASADGQAFMRSAGEGWYEAAVAGGDDPAAARAAADRTIAFYTGTDPTVGHGERPPGEG